MAEFAYDPLRQCTDCETLERMLDGDIGLVDQVRALIHMMVRMQRAGQRAGELIEIRG